MPRKSVLIVSLAALLAAAGPAAARPWCALTRGLFWAALGQADAAAPVRQSPSVPRQCALEARRPGFGGAG